MSTQPLSRPLGFGAQMRSDPRTFWIPGNLFGNVLSGTLYGKLARDAGRPDLMWLVFALMAFAAAVTLAIYNRTVVRSRGHAALA